MTTNRKTIAQLEELKALYDRGATDNVLQLIGPVEGLLCEDEMPTAQTAGTLELVGLIRHDQGRVREAADAIEKAGLVIRLGDPSRIALASCYAELGKIDLARELYLQLALSRQLPPELMLQVAAGLAAIDAPQLAMQVCEWITERDDSVARAYYDMGVYNASCGNALYLTEALTHRALQLDPGNVHYRIGLVSLLIQLDREDEASVAFGSVNTQQIATINCHSCLGRITKLLKRFGDDVRANACDQRIAALAIASSASITQQVRQSESRGARK